jgi:hypothetical protein
LSAGILKAFTVTHAMIYHDEEFRSQILNPKILETTNFLVVGRHWVGYHYQGCHQNKEQSHDKKRWHANRIMGDFCER